MILETLLASHALADVGWTAGSAEMSFYGFIRPSYSLATDAVASFGSPTGSGPTLAWTRDNQVAASEAAPPAGVTHPHSARSSFNVGQSRFGFYAKQGEIGARIEMDFVDFDRSEATTTIRPRLRIAGADIAISERMSLFAGQDWDIIAAAKPFTYNYVGLYFRAGNTGFMRPQARLTFKDENRAELLSLMIGAAGLNDSTANAGAVERGVFPAFGFRYNALRLKELTAGVAAVGAPRRIEPTGAGDVKTMPAWLAKGFADWMIGEVVEIRANFYGGINPQSIAANSIATVSYTGSQSEIGGYLTANAHAFKNVDLFGGTGITRLTDGSELRVGDLRENWISRIGADWKFVDQAHFITELSYFRSRYHWTNAESITGKALQLEAGLTVNI